MMRAPVVIVPCSSKAAYLGRYAEPDKGWTDRDEARWPVPFWHMDAAMASLLILQTAVDEGLGACFFGIPPEKVSAVRAEFAIPDAFDPVGAITLGHPATTTGAKGSPSRRRRLDLDEVVHRGAWSGSRLTWHQSIQSRRRTPPAGPPGCLGSEIPRISFARVCPGVLITDDGGTHRREKDMIVLGLILLIIGLVASISILTTIGIILLVVGLILNLVPIGGTRRRVSSRGQPTAGHSVLERAPDLRGSGPSPMSGRLGCSRG